MGFILLFLFYFSSLLFISIFYFLLSPLYFFLFTFSSLLSPLSSLLSPFSFLPSSPSGPRGQYLGHATFPIVLLMCVHTAHCALHCTTFLPILHHRTHHHKRQGQGSGYQKVFADSLFYGKSQGGDVSIPWYMSSKGYGFVWNLPSFGEQQQRSSV